MTKEKKKKTMIVQKFMVELGAAKKINHTIWNGFYQSYYTQISRLWIKRLKYTVKFNVV